MKRYCITKYTLKRAKKIGVTVKTSHNPKKKLDVFRQGKRVASIGAKGMMDYPTYIQTQGLTYAQTRKRLYKKRHEKDRKQKGTPGWYADQLLW